MTEIKTQAAKDGLRFDWYPILQADFIDDLAAEVMATIEPARTSTRGSSPAAAEKRTQDQLIIAKHLLSALYCAYSTVSIKKAPTRISVIKKTRLSQLIRLNIPLESIIPFVTSLTCTRRLNS